MDEDSLYAKRIGLMDLGKARKQKAIEAKRLALPTRQGGAGKTSMEVPIDLKKESCPILTTLFKDLPELMNNKPKKSQDMKKLRFKKDLKEKMKLEKRGLRVSRKSTQ